MIRIKTDNGHYVEIYDTEHKILEKANEVLWNTDEENPIAVDKKRYENGDYVESDVPAEPIVDEVEEEPVVEEVIEEQPEEVVIEEPVEEEPIKHSGAED